MAWVGKGFAKSNPKEYELLEEEIQYLKKDDVIANSIKEAKNI